MKAVLVFGTRPQIIKSAPLIHAASRSHDVELEVIHTGQHYDYQMSKAFFDELDLPDPVINLGVGSGSHAWQTGKMLIELEGALLKIKPDAVIVPGDTNSTLAGALAAVKLQLPVAHIEAGARSYDLKMPEEVNRILTDHCSSLLFVPSECCRDNLTKEGIDAQKIHLCGDTMYDVLLQHLPSARSNAILEKLGVEEERYVFLTLHRPENVDNPINLENIVNAILSSDELTVVFAVHPRTKQNLEKGGLARRLEEAKHIKLVPPVGFHESLKLTMHARAVLTDSGGLQKESFWLRTPCITLRENTEWVETVRMGWNVLVGSNTAAIIDRIKKCATIGKSEQAPRGRDNPYGDGSAGERIMRTLREVLAAP